MSQGEVISKHITRCAICDATNELKTCGSCNQFLCSTAHNELHSQQCGKGWKNRVVHKHRIRLRRQTIQDPDEHQQQEATQSLDQSAPILELPCGPITLV
jgi:hypothetical protein